MQTIKEIEKSSMCLIPGGFWSIGVFCGTGFDSAGQVETGSGSGV